MVGTSEIVGYGETVGESVQAALDDFGDLLDFEFAVVGEYEAVGALVFELFPVDLVVLVDLHEADEAYPEVLCRHCHRRASDRVAVSELNSSPRFPTPSSS